MAKNGVNLNAVDQFGKTALHEAVYRGDVRAIEVLARNGANMNSVDQNGRTAMHEAVYRGIV